MISAAFFFKISQEDEKEPKIVFSAFCSLES